MNKSCNSKPEEELTGTGQQTENAPPTPEKSAGLSRQTAEEAELLAELDALRREKRDRELCEDESLGEIYRSLREEVWGLTEFAQQKGTPIDPEDAFHALLVQNFAGLIAQAERRGEERALQHLAQISAASPMALAGSGTRGPEDYGKMDDAAFDRLVKRALRGELRSGGSL